MRRPSPGRLKMFSMMTEPPAMMGICSATRVTTGISAFFTAWRSTTLRSSRPLAQAVRT